MLVKCIGNRAESYVDLKYIYIYICIFYSMHAYTFPKFIFAWKKLTCDTNKLQTAYIYDSHIYIYIYIHIYVSYIYIYILLRTAHETTYTLLSL